MFVGNNETTRLKLDYKTKHKNIKRLFGKHVYSQQQSLAVEVKCLFPLQLRIAFFSIYDFTCHWFHCEKVEERKTE